MTVSIKKLPPSLAAQPKRRMGRGKWFFVRHRRANARSAELDPEATRSTDQTLTEISLKSANSECNATVLREHEKAADRLAHIHRGLTARQNDVLIKVLDVVEAGDSLHEIARKANLHTSQVGRAFHAAREADKLRIFKQASRERRPPAISYRPYNPKGVPMETVMMPHQGPILYTINVPDQRTSTSFLHPPMNGCSHSNRQWLRVGFGGLRLTCLDCKAELDRAGILSKP